LAEEEARRLCETEPDLHACDDPEPFSTNEEEDDKDDEDSLEPNQDRGKCLEVVHPTAAEGGAGQPVGALYVIDKRRP
jgi:hypothetical protein